MTIIAIAQRLCIIQRHGNLQFVLIFIATLTSATESLAELKSIVRLLLMLISNIERDKSASLVAIIIW